MQRSARRRLLYAAMLVPFIVITMACTYSNLVAEPPQLLMPPWTSSAWRGSSCVCHARRPLGKARRRRELRAVMPSEVDFAIHHDCFKVFLVVHGLQPLARGLLARNLQRQMG